MEANRTYFDPGTTPELGVAMVPQPGRTIFLRIMTGLACRSGPESRAEVPIRRAMPRAATATATAAATPRCHAGRGGSIRAARRLGATRR